MQQSSSIDYSAVQIGIEPLQSMISAFEGGKKAIVALFELLARLKYPLLLDIILDNREILNLAQADIDTSGQTDVAGKARVGQPGNGLSASGSGAPSQSMRMSGISSSAATSIKVLALLRLQHPAPMTI